MKKELGKGSVEWRFMADYWKYVQEWYEPEDNAQWWENFREASNKLADKYDGNEFAVSHVLNFCMLQERRARNGRK